MEGKGILHTKLWGWSQWLKYMKIKMHCYGTVWGRHCRRLQYNSQSPLSTTVPVVLSHYSSDKIVSLHCYCVAPSSCALSSIPYNCFEENCVTAQRTSPFLEPGSGNIENGNLPSLVLRSNMLPKLLPLIFQYFVLRSSVSFSPNFPGPTILQGCKHHPQQR